MAKEKQMTKRLTFTEDEAEQAILAAAEARVAAGDFPAFNELCKAALQAFLNPDTPRRERSPVSLAEEAVTAQLSARVAQLAQAIDEMRTGQENFTTLMQVLTVRVETAAAAAQASPVPPPVSESLQALQAEVRQLGSNLAAALVQTQEPPAPVHADQPMGAMTTPSVDNITVSEVTVGRLSRFLEDF